MKIEWSPEALGDLDRLQTFLANFDLEASEALADRLAAAPYQLLDFPRKGQRLTDFGRAEIREWRIGRYQLRYQLVSDRLLVLRNFHVRENRW